MKDGNSKRIVILGGSFAGLTAAYELQSLLKGQHDIVVVDRSDQFTFIPSLIWLPFGWRNRKQITFPIGPALQNKGIRFVQAVITAINKDSHTVDIVETTGGKPTQLDYDFLVIATGPHVDFEAVPGLGPAYGNTYSICNLEHAEHTAEAWQKFTKNPGPVIIGATQGAACYGAAYEFVFNAEFALRKLHLRDRCPVTYVTSEPYAGHFGISGMTNSKPMTEWFFRHLNIDWVTDAVIDHVEECSVHFKAGKRHRAKNHSDEVEDMAGKSLPFNFGMIIPPFLGADVVRRSGLGNERGFIVVDDYFRTLNNPEVYAAGVSVAVSPTDKCEAGCAVPKTGYISEVMAKGAARNIAATINNQPLVAKPAGKIDALCLMDAGNNGVMMVTDRIYAPKSRKIQILIPGPWIHWGKILFEKYFIWKMKVGAVRLP